MTNFNRRFLLFSCLLVFFIVIGIGFVCQEEVRAADCPGGSYNKTCRKTSCDGEELKAECKRMNGTWKRTSLQGYTAYSGDIANCDGTLKGLCGSDCPAGSYSKSCMCCTTKSIVTGRSGREQIQLSCLCKNKKGKYLNTSLGDISGCTGGIENDNGTLRCAK